MPPVPGPPPMPPVGFIFDDPPPPPPLARWTAAEAEVLEARVESLENRAAWAAAAAEAVEARVTRVEALAARAATLTTHERLEARVEDLEAEWGEWWRASLESVDSEWEWTEYTAEEWAAWRAASANVPTTYAPAAAPAAAWYPW